jgi:hypothetical protein
LSKGTYYCNRNFDTRFAIRYTSKTLGIRRFANEDGIFISNKNKQIKVTSTSKLIDKVQIYDLAGKLIYSKTKLIQTKQ